MTANPTPVLQNLAEKGFVILSLLLFSGAIAPFISATHPLNPIKEALPILNFAITVGILAFHWQRVLPFVLKEPLIWVWVGIALASALWSSEPFVTLERAVPLLRVTVFALYFAARFTLKEQLQLLAASFSIAIALSLLLGFVLKQYGVVGAGYLANMEDLVHAGSWRGAYIHKTYLGSMMTVSALVWLFCAVKAQRYKLVMWLGVFLSVYVLLRSTTKAALAILVLLLILIPIYRVLRWQYSVLLPLLTALLLIGGSVLVVLISNAESLLASIGKDTTISGRTDIWPLLLNQIGERPWLGYGYLTFWHGGWEGEPADIWQELRWGFEPPHAHNGLLEVVLSFGLLGFALFCLHFLTILVRSLGWLRRVESAEGLVPLTCITLTFLLNLTESYFARSDLYWILYVSASLSTLHRVSDRPSKRRALTVQRPILIPDQQ